MKTTKTNFIYDEIIMQGMFFCPYGKETQSCFFQWLQKKTSAEKVNWYNSLTLRDKQDLMYCHAKCNAKASVNFHKLKYYQNN
jgi:hypothetical protein